MLFRIITIAALCSLALGQNAPSGAKFTDPQIQDCNQECLNTLKSSLGCDPSLLACVCPDLANVAGNTDYVNCLVDKCGATEVGNDGYVLGANCGKYTWNFASYTGGGGVGGSPTTDAMPAATSNAGSPASNAGSQTTAGSSSTNTPNAAARSEVKVAAMGLAIAAAFAL
ncbi:hypothetical protein TWF694_007310 [Orbilia ellipsospora]|uniref:Extracellular membrane protein CFEM domain-containing protein n=1 Tax=Orbilia ellipsospora TaxID=2528407 RepID=A0AAV9XHG1_9PEZI